MELAELKKSQRDSVGCVIVACFFLTSMSSLLYQLEEKYRYNQPSSVVKPHHVLCGNWRKDYEDHFKKLNKWLVSGTGMLVVAKFV